MAIRQRETLFREVGLEGKLHQKDPAYNLIVGINGEALFTDDAEAFLPYGRFVVEDGAYNNYRLPRTGDTAAELAGLSLAVEYYEHNIATDAFGDSVHGYPVPSNGKLCPITIVKKGVMYLLAETNITAGPFFVRINANAVPLQYEGLGRIRSDADGTNAVAQPTYVRLLQDVEAGCLAKVYVDMPAYGSYV